MSSDIAPDVLRLPLWYLTDAAVERLVTQKPGSKQALDVVLEKADIALVQLAASVTDKKTLPPSGDRRDYMSLAIYTWPNPDTADGLPYIHKDGLVNPEVEDYDLPRMYRMSGAVEVCTLAALHTGELKYAEKAAELLRVWFIDEATAMRPHLNYGQGVPGECDGRCYGIIETTRFLRLTSSVKILENLAGKIDGFAFDIGGKLRQWFAEYANWMQTSELGKLESEVTNNHRVWHLVQLCSYFSFCGDDDKTREIIAPVMADILAQQMAPDGSMPRELARTRSLHYSIFVLVPMLVCAEIAKPLGIDLLGITTDNGSSIRKGWDWLYPYLAGDAEWTWEQIITEDPYEDTYAALRMAANVLADEKYEVALQKLTGDEYGQLVMDVFMPPSL